jgi:pimeloyl-ACP methyl ester carboxylesterase
VYVVDRPGHGRARSGIAVGEITAPPTYEAIAEVLFGNAEPGVRSPRHTQWPGTRAVRSDLVDQFCAGQGPFAIDLADAENAMQSAGAELLDRIGPAILLTHSLGGPFGWRVADARPASVKAIVAIEPAGPPFSELGPSLGALKWGLTAGPLAYDPPVRDPAELRLETRQAPRNGFKNCLVQTDPPMQLANLRRLPVLIVTAEASDAAYVDHGTVDFLRQAGVTVDHLRLEEAGVLGNGHLMMLERNSDEIAGHLVGWLARTVVLSGYT